MSALDWASLVGSVPTTIQAILRRGAEVNSCAYAQRVSALHSAARNDHAGAINFLIEAGADMEMEAAGGMTPLCLAAQSGACLQSLARSLAERGKRRCARPRGNDAFAPDLS